jgi:hypothetical protein
VQTNAALLVTKINYVTSGCTCVTVYVRDKKLYVANVGDSRAVMAFKPSAEDVAAAIAANPEQFPPEEEGDIPIAERFIAKDLSRDHKPDDPEEMARIVAWGGYVCPPAEVGLSARVYLDPGFTMIGLAMARSIGEPAFFFKVSWYWCVFEWSAECDLVQCIWLISGSVPPATAVQFAAVKFIPKNCLLTHVRPH